MAHVKPFLLGEFRVAKIQQWFVVFAAIVLLFIIVKWVYLWRKIQSMGPQPQPQREEHEKQEQE